MHVSRQMHVIAVQGMAFAAAGCPETVTGAVTQEVIAVLTVLNAFRAAFQPQVTPHDL